MFFPHKNKILMSRCCLDYLSIFIELQRLDYAWVQTGVVESDCLINNVSWNLEGTRLITAGDKLQMWAPKGSCNAQQPREYLTLRAMQYNRLMIIVPHLNLVRMIV